MFNGFSAVPRQTKSKQPAEVGAVNVKTVASVMVRKTSKAKGPVAHLTLELRTDIYQKVGLFMEKAQTIPL